MFGLGEIVSLSLKLLIEAFGKPKHVGRSGPEISHLMFVDDMLLFTRAVN